MRQHINHLFSTKRDKRRSFPKFLVSKREPREQPVYEDASDISQTLEDEMLNSWYQQKIYIRRYASRLRQRNA